MNRPRVFGDPRCGARVAARVLERALTVAMPAPLAGRHLAAVIEFTNTVTFQSVALDVPFVASSFEGLIAELSRFDPGYPYESEFVEASAADGIDQETMECARRADGALLLLVGLRIPGRTGTPTPDESHAVGKLALSLLREAGGRATHRRVDEYRSQLLAVTSASEYERVWQSIESVPGPLVTIISQRRS